MRDQMLRVREIIDAEGVPALLPRTVTHARRELIVRLNLDLMPVPRDGDKDAAAKYTGVLDISMPEKAEKLKQSGEPSPRIEGLPAADWVLIDAGDVVVHLFRPEVRSFYNLERMWGFGEDGQTRQMGSA